ncbi:unnamed protein product [Callosobruchus maculatus]|uniref:Odorant receptor n=1 Tax=Callosobruchus maculatus TaxID=64391 RepID=A0A653DH96_CALMS|nr:unnamed protein product [Callosobruchus maculatus]
MMSVIFSIVAFDLLVRTFLVLAEAQFKMLNQEFLLLYDQHELDQGLLYQRIRKCVQHHSFLIDFMNDFSDTFSTALLFFVGNITMSLCTCMYAIVQDHFNISHWVHLVAGLNMIYTCYSWPAQDLMNQANEVPNSIYSSHWQNHLASAKHLLMALPGCQKPFEVKAGRLLTVDMGMFLASMFKLSTLYFKRSQVLHLFEQTRYRFWNIKGYDQMVKSTKWIRNMHASFFIIYTVTTMIKPHMKGGRSLSFRIYTPEWVPRMAVLLYEDFAVVVGISSLVAFDLLVRTFLVLAEAQFKMLNQEFLLLYDRHEFDQGLLYQRIRKCVQHHSFLIDFMNRFTDIFSTALLLFVAGLNMIYTCYSL